MKKLAIIMIAAIFAAAANAMIIHVNMYASSGGNQNPQDAALLEGPNGGLGETWNQFNTTTGSGLLDSTGATTTVGFSNNVSSGWVWGSPELQAVKAGRAHFGKGTDTTHTITGLVPGRLYNLWVASYVHNSTLAERALGEWSTSNLTSTDGPQIIDSRITGLNGSSWEYGVNYVLFENVQADAAGQIVLFGDACDVGDYGDTYATRLALSAWQIEEVDMSQPQADAGSNWITWSGKPVTLDDSSATNNDTGAGDLTLQWTADAPAGVTVDIPNPGDELPTVTVTKPAPDGEATVVTLTLTVSQAGKSDAASSMQLQVYDDACAAAVGAGEHVITAGDFNSDCLTDLKDLELMASSWLLDFSLTGSVDK